MRGVRSTIALVLVLAGLGAYIYFVTWKLPPDSGPQRDKVFASVQSDQIEELQVKAESGEVTTLNESVFTTIPGAPAWVAKASRFVRKSSQFGLKDINLQGHNAIQGSFRFVG